MQKIIDSIVKLKSINASLYEGSAIGSFNSKQFYGGVYIAQAINAGYSQATENFHLHNLNAYYLKKGQVKLPLQYHVKKVDRSKDFNRIKMNCVQNDEELVSFGLSFKLMESSKSFIHEPYFEEPEAFDKCLQFTEIIPHLINPSPDLVNAIKGFEEWFSDFPFTIRLIDMPFLIPKKVENPVFSYWFQLKEKIDASHADIAIKHLLIGFMSDYGMQYPILAKDSWSSVGFITSLDHSIWFHRSDFDINQRFFIVNRCLNAGANLTLNIGSIWTEDRKCIATAVQQGLLRKHGGGIVAKTPYQI